MNWKYNTNKLKGGCLDYTLSITILWFYIIWICYFLLSQEEQLSWRSIIRQMWSKCLINKTKWKRENLPDCEYKYLSATVLGASVRNSARGKGHEEGGSAYAKAGSSLRSPPGNSRASTPKIIVCLLYCFVLSPTPLTLRGAVLGMTRVF